MTSGLLFGLATGAGLSGQRTKGEAKHMSIREVQVQRVGVVSTQPFDQVIA
jgi:hypothetical protein